MCKNIKNLNEIYGSFSLIFHFSSFDRDKSTKNIEILLLILSVRKTGAEAWW